MVCYGYQIFKWMLEDLSEVFTFNGVCCKKIYGFRTAHLCNVSKY